MDGVKRVALSLALLASGGLFGGAANADVDAQNPILAMTHEAIVASGLCIARYAQTSDDMLPAYVAAKRVAQSCETEISRSAGLVTYMGGNPELFATNLQYIKETMTLNTISRLRAAKGNR
jgi:hypothetical protein